MRTSSDASNRKALIIYSLLALISAVYIALLAFTPITIHADAISDDELYISHAQFLAAGNWLGPFNQFTLAKGPGYSFFLALSAWSRLSNTASQAIFNGLAIGAFAWVIKRLSGSGWLAFATFFLILWNPALFQIRAVRDEIYPAQTLLFLAALTYALFCAARAKPAALTGAIAGLSLGWLSLTREETIWMMPGAAVLISGAALITWMRPRSPRPPTIAVLSTLCAFGLAMGIFRFVNLTAYGSFAGVDSQESNFVGAMQALQNVRVGKPIPYLPVSRPARLKIYEISPAFASLKKYLDPPGTPVWQWGCAPYPLTCGDIAGGWFFWALRDAVAAEGHYQTPAAAAQFFGELRDQVRSACQQGSLQCDNWKLGLTPHLSSEQISEIPKVARVGLAALLFETPPRFVGAVSSGSPAQLLDAWQFLNRPPHTPTAATSVLGASTDSPTRLALGAREFLIDVYGYVMPPLCWAGFLAFAFSVVMMGLRRAATDSIIWMAASLWILIPARLLLLAVIDVSSFPAMHQLYLAPAYALITAAALLSIWSAIDQLAMKCRWAGRNQDN